MRYWPWILLFHVWMKGEKRLKNQKEKSKEREALGKIRFTQAKWKNFIILFNFQPHLIGTYYKKILLSSKFPHASSVGKLILDFIFSGNRAICRTQKTTYCFTDYIWSVVMIMIMMAVVITPENSEHVFWPVLLICCSLPVSYIRSLNF